MQFGATKIYQDTYSVHFRMLKFKFNDSKHKKYFFNSSKGFSLIQDKIISRINTNLVMNSPIKVQK